MMCESTKRLEFKARITPHLDRLMQFSICLTQNGRDATKLLSDAIAEAFRKCETTGSSDGYSSRLHTIITRRYFIGFRQPVLPILSRKGSARRQGRDVAERSSFTMSTIDLNNAIAAGDGDRDGTYLKAIAGLPPVFRSAMILSYLEGFTSSEIADIAGKPPYSVSLLLNRGRRLIHDELFEHLIGEIGLEQVEERKSESA